MSGSTDIEEHGIPEKIRDTMIRFDVDEKRARLLLGCTAVLSSELACNKH